MFISKRSNGIYYVHYTDSRGRKQRRSTHSKRKAVALKYVSSFKTDEEQTSKAKLTINLGTFFDEYMIYSRGVHTLKTQKSIATAFRELIRIVGDIRLSALGVREVERFLATKKSEASEWTARKYFIHLSSAIETAIRWGMLQENPFKKVAKPRMREVQPAFFSKEEFQRLIHAIDDPVYRNLSTAALYTGMRLGELLNLQWTDVDMNARIVHVRNSAQFTTKTKKNRTLPMSEGLAELFLRMQAGSVSELVFHRDGRRIEGDYASRRFKKFVRKAGLRPELHFHSIRHSFASWLVKDGVSLFEVQKLLGHSDIKVTQIYAHLQPEVLHSTVNKISFV